MTWIPAEFDSTTARSLHRQRASGFALRGGSSRSSGSTGFTLIEIILSIVIFSLLAGVMTFTMFGSISGRYLEEGSQQFETVIRMTRAEASNQGRRMRIAWSPSEERIMVMWEPQPLAQPGQFVEYTGASWGSYIPNDMVRIVGNHREGATEEDALTFSNNQSASAMAEAGEQTIIDFYPDGSCDTTIVELASRDDTDERRAVVQMDGVNYFMSTQIMDETELGLWLESMNISTEDSRGY